MGGCLGNGLGLFGSCGCSASPAGTFAGCCGSSGSCGSSTRMYNGCSGSCGSLVEHLLVD